MARKSRKNLQQPEQAATSVLLPELEEAKIPAAIYGRLSVEDDEKEESMETQIALVQDYINRSRELSYVDTYFDNGFTGTNFKRPACGKLYRKDIWKHERFPKGKLYEDYATIYKITCGCSRVTVLKENLYWYRTRVGSIMKSKLTVKNMQLLDIAQEVTNYLKCEVPVVENEARYLQMVTYLKLMKGILDNGFSAFPEEQDRIKNYVLSCKPLLKMSFAKKKDVIKVKSFLLNKRLFYMIYTLGEKTHL